MPFWGRLALFLVVLVPWGLAVGVAVSGHVSAGGLGGLAGGLGAPLGRWWSDRDWRRLPPEDRRRVSRAQREAQPTGSPELDRLALVRARRRAADARGARYVTPVLLAGLVAVPVIAAVRASGWWVLAGVGLLPYAVVLLGQTYRRPDAAERLARPQQALSVR